MPIDESQSASFIYSRCKMKANYTEKNNKSTLLSLSVNINNGLFFTPNDSYIDG